MFFFLVFCSILVFSNQNSVAEIFVKKNGEFNIEDESNYKESAEILKKIQTQKESNTFVKSLEDSASAEQNIALNEERQLTSNSQKNISEFQQNIESKEGKGYFQNKQIPKQNLMFLKRGEELSSAKENSYSREYQKPQDITSEKKSDATEPQQQFFPKKQSLDPFFSLKLQCRKV